MRVLASAQREYDRQQRLTALAVAEALRVASRGARAVASATRTYQAAAVTLSLTTFDAILAEQAVDTAQDATVTAASLLTDGAAMVRMLNNTASTQAMSLLVRTLVADASRTARAVDAATRPAVTGWVRSLQLPSCGRCVVLAGRVYRYSEGFLRHSGCDCLHTPIGDASGTELVTDPAAAFARGQVTGLSKADTEAVRAGADLGQVVNANRRQAGLVVGSSVMVRGGRLTPAGCLQFATDRADAMRLLTRYGYITTP